MRNKRSNSLGVYNLADFDYAPGGVIDPYVALYGTPPSASVANSAPAGTHPLYDAAHNRRLLERESQITAAFNAIEPAMQEVAAMQSQDGFADRAQAMVLSRLGFNLPSESLKSSWLEPLNMRGLYAYSAFQTFLLLAERDFDRSQAEHSDGEPAEELIRKWGFHAIDISPCADGRLSGVVDYILRVPPTVVANRKSFAGAMFDVEESMRNWVDIELRRYREAVPNPASEPTRYLKIGVYHTSSSDPQHEGCAAHGSDERVAAQQLLDRLMAFSKAIENSHCCGASVATLMIGVDTDTDAIKLHVPNARGEMSLDRYIDNAALFDSTSALEREAAKEAIRLAVAETA
ncbi:MAG: carboxysome shell carbonic anhydrase, partial [Sulfuricaulis sp.]